jgi:hypothetical protein
VVVPKHGAALGTAQNKLKRQTTNRGEEDVVVEISTYDMLMLGARRHLAGGGGGDDEASMNSEAESLGELEGVSQVKVIERRDLVAFTSAGDNDVEVSGQPSRTELVLMQSLLTGL